VKDFEFYKTIRLSKNKKTQKVFSKINSIYETIPDTKGCLENISKEGGCNGWCCKIQTPQLLYSEFLLIWNFVSRNWSDDKLCDLFEKCMLNAVDDIPSKGCVFFDDEENLCRIHKVRPYNCRIYGITPDEEFNPRYEKLKEEYKTIIGASIKPQCKLVSTVNDIKVTVDDINDWWNKLIDAEKMLGIPGKMATDDFGGTYRTPHDHILLYNIPENVLNALSGIKLYVDHMDKIKAIREIMSTIRNYFRGITKK